jgi:hypothetical protein
MHPNFPPK